MGLMKKYSQFLRELPSNTVVFAFGRFNPPTTGHELLVKAVKKLATQNKAAHAIYASKSQDAKKNPLTVEKKVNYLKLMFPGTNFVAANPTERTFIEAAKALNKKYKNLIMVAGSDRIPEYERILNTYNGKEFHFDTVQVISAGERDPDSDDASGMSASKMRAVASKGDYSQFKKGLPSAMREIDGRRLMNDVRQGMGLEAVKEQLNLVKDDLREQYFRGEIFNIGDIVESAGISYEIVKRGSNHLLLKEESGKLVSKWIQDISLKQEELNLEETMIPEELTTKTLKSQDKIKVARIIATMLGIENAESSANPDQLVNNALRKVRTKSLNAESLSILTKMLKLAQEVGIKYDLTLVPSKLKEGTLQPSGDTKISVTTDSPVVNKNSTYNIAKGNLRYKDYIKLRDINAGVHHTKPGHSFNHDDETERKMKVKYQTEAVDKNHPIVKEYDGLKKNHDIKSLRGLIKTQHKIIDTSEFKTKEHAISHYLRAKHGNKKVADAFGLKEDTLDEISSKLAGNYYGAVTKKHIDKVGVKANMYDRIEKDMGKKRKQGIDRAMDRVMGARKTNEQYEEMLQELEEAISTIDKGEYDYEGAMARTQLQTTIRSSQELINMLSLDDNLPEWVQSKITLAQDYISSVRDYLKSKEELGEAVDMAALRKQLNKHTELAVKANRAGDDEAVKKHQVTMNKIKDRMNKMVREASEVCPNCEQTVDKCECESKDVVRDDSQQVGANNSKGFDAFFEEDESGAMQHGVVDMSNYEDNYNNNMDDEEISDEELDAMADEIQDMEHIMDVYEDDEFAIVDDETGEELEETEEEKSMNEQAIMEVLSRIERMKAKMRIRRTKAKRERATKIALKRYSGTATINKRSRRLAVKLMKKRLLRGRDPTKISVGEKERVERIIQRKKNVLGRLAMRLAPRVRKIEKARMAHTKFTAPAPAVGI